MSLLEGHGNSVMNQLGREHVAGQARMARVLHARRQSTGMAAFLHKLVGLESKMRQYEVGETFIAAVEREAGPRAIDAAWRGPEWLPDARRAAATPRSWLARVDAAAVSPSRRGAADRTRDRWRAARRRRRARPRRWWSAAPGGADSVALLALAADAGLAPVAVHVDHGLRPDERGATPTRCARLAARSRCRVRRAVGVDVAPGPNLEARGARRAVRRARGRARRARRRVRARRRTPPTTRPRPCCSTCCAARPAAGLAGMARAARTRRAPAARVPPRRDARALRRRSALAVVARPDERRPTRSAGSPCAARCSRCSTASRAATSSRCSRGRPTSCAQSRSSSTSSRRAAWPGDRRAVGIGARRASRRCSRAERCACWLGPPPPSRAEVDAGARGRRAASAAATELAGGRAVRRSAGRLLSRPSASVPRPWTESATSAAIVVSEDELAVAIAELGKEITADYAGRPPLLVGVLKGAFVFMSDLSRAIDLPVEFDFMAVSSYGSATRSSGVVRIIKDLDLDLTDRARADRRGHRRLRPHARVPPQEPRRARARRRWRCARCW